LPQAQAAVQNQNRLKPPFSAKMFRYGIRRKRNM
jgi:hypothetical protein